MSHETRTSKRSFWENGFLPFCRPSLSEEAIQEVVDCLRSGWVTTGPRVQTFEKELGRYIGAPHVLTLASATAGLYLALQGLGVGPGDEVITTPLTFAATVNVIALVGARPVLADVDPQTYNLDIDQVAKKITPRTKVILPVHFAGLPVDMEALNRLAQKHHVRVVEDAAHAIGSTFKGQKIGGFGDIQVFSFHATKNMMTGEGGALVTRDGDLIEKLGKLRFHGIDRPAWDRFSKKGSPHYDVVVPALKFNMTDMQAALGIHQLRDLDTFISKRHALAMRYMDLLKARPYFDLPAQGDETYGHSWHLFAPQIREKDLGMDRDSLLQALKDHNIGTSLHYRPVHLFSCYQEAYGYRPGDFPVAEEIGQRVLSLPLFPDLTEADQDRVVSALDAIADFRSIA